MFEAEKPAGSPEERCEAPGCAVAGPPPETCVAWGHRLCYRHFAAYWAWSEHLVANRAPTPAEWRVFLAWIAAKQPAATEAA